VAARKGDVGNRERSIGSVGFAALFLSFDEWWANDAHMRIQNMLGE